MIITNKTLPRRTFLRGLGATMALPAARFDVLAADRRGADRRRSRRCGSATSTRRTASSACNDKSPRQFMWTPKTAGANFEFSPTMKALEPFREQRQRVQRPGAGHRPRARRRPRRPRARDRDVAHRRASVQDRRRRLQARHLGRPDRRAGVRQAHAAGVARARRSSSRRSPATATRATPARTCRCRGAAETSPLPAEINPRTVFERLFGDGESTDADGAHGAAREPEERARLRHRQPDAAAGQRSAPATSGSSTNISRRSATSSAAFSAPRNRTSR